MSEVVNLRRERKRAQREAARTAGDANAAKHGLTKGERRRLEVEKSMAAARLDGHKRETED